MDNIVKEALSPNNKKKYFIFALVTVIFISCFGYWYWLRTPQYSLKIIKDAVETHDLQKFEKHVDIETLVSRVIDQVLDSKVNNKNEVQDEQTNAFAAGLIKMLKPQFVLMAKDQIRSYVEKGSTETQPKNNQPKNKNESTPNFSINDIYKNNGGGSVDFKGIEYVNKDGKIAIVGLKLFYPKLNSDVILELKMREMDGYWQIAEINNLSAFMLKLEELEKNKLAELNKPIINEMNAAIKIDSIQIVPVNNGPYSKAVRFPTNITFLSPKDIKEIGMLIEVKNQEGKILFKNIMRSAGSTYPGKVSTINWGKEINPFIKSDADLFNTPVNKLTVQIQPQFLKFADGSELKLIDTLQ
ncbi:hypothetical protein [Pelosinus sp. IPA-1]|uniref:hypothetical protein n=1 Tax=Pelosinus sp. IPA-1 TaxID=3029569 RepID=UPI0024362338|nr:hypothetical protein [Pelosinus sp. IPA-1]GMA99462.1 hypothetical protein PIPA1_22620 [Pelosinus sp. IPA-1]